MIFSPSFLTISQSKCDARLPCGVYPIEHLIDFLCISLSDVLPIIHAHHFVSRVSKNLAQRIIEESEISSNIYLKVAIFDVFKNGSISFL